MSYAFYNWLHVLSLIAIFASLGAITIYTATGGLKAELKQRRMLALTHGFGMVGALVAGFGLMARAGISFGDPWVYTKLFLWLVVGVYPAFVWRLKG